MENRRKKIEEFFSLYERNFNDSLSGHTDNINDIMARSFADCFVESSPAGVNCGKNDEQFANVIRQGIGFYRSIGSESMHITDKEITFLDDLHAMCKISWKYVYRKDGKEGTIDFVIFYFVRTTDDSIKIFAYIAGDEQKALKEKGLV